MLWRNRGLMTLLMIAMLWSFNASRSDISMLDALLAHSLKFIGCQHLLGSLLGKDNSCSYQPQNGPQHCAASDIDKMPTIAETGSEVTKNLSDIVDIAELKSVAGTAKINAENAQKCANRMRPAAKESQLNAERSKMAECSKIAERQSCASADLQLTLPQINLSSGKDLLNVDIHMAKDARLKLQAVDRFARAMARFNLIQIKTGNYLKVVAWPASKRATSWSLHASDFSVNWRTRKNCKAKSDPDNNIGAVGNIVPATSRAISRAIPMAISGSVARREIPGGLTGGSERFRQSVVVVV
jgi:hypothetical protein